MTVTRRLAAIAIGLIVVAQAGPASAAPGDLDPSFGGDGIVDTNFGRKRAIDQAEAIAVQPDGRIVAVGWTLVGGGRFPLARFALARYLTDGTLDASFGGDGKVTVDFGPKSDVATDVAIQPDGRIVVVGEAWSNTRHGRFAVARLTADGQLDTSFSVGGTLTTDFSTQEDTATGVVVRADGTIVVVGGTGPSYGPRGRFAAARYLPDGTLDPSFGGDGKVTTDLTERRDSATGVALQSDGRVVAVGHAAGYTRFALVRYAEDGSLDPSLGGDGTVLTNFNPGYDWGTSVAIQPDGRIVAVGAATSGDYYRFAVARYSPDGVLDPTFSDDGKAVTNVGASSGHVASSVAIQQDGRVVVGGTYYSEASSGETSAVFARYQEDGSLDPSFGVDGTVWVNWTIALGVRDLALQADGRIVVASATDLNYTRFAILRLLGV